MQKTFKVKSGSNKACTRQVGFCGIFEHFSGLEFFLLSGIFPARPLAGNANRWQELALNLSSSFKN